MSRFMFRLHRKVHEAAVRRPRATVAGLVLAALCASLPLLHLEVDMSFRPLFADDAALAAATREFEMEFGQRSGAYIGAILDFKESLSPDHLPRIAALSESVLDLEGVTEVVSLTHLDLPRVVGSEVLVQRLIPPAWLEAWPPGVSLERLVADPLTRRFLVSEDGKKTLLLARLSLPLQDLSGRSEVIERFRGVVERAMTGVAELHFVGVSVVEQAYARIVLVSLARSLVLTTAAVVLVLLFLFRRVAVVAITMIGVGLATPASLGLLQLAGQDLTMINSMVPVMILIIGVADAIHMLTAFQRRLARGHDTVQAIRGMYATTALPCMLTTLTTVLAFLSLRVAGIRAIRDFGTNVALGVALVYVVNLLLIPALLRLVPVGRLLPARTAPRFEGWFQWSVAVVTRRPLLVTICCTLLTAGLALALPRLDASQRFNEELARDHPVRVGQSLLEAEFAGFLGPEVSVRRRDGAGLLTAETFHRLRAYGDAIAALPEVLRVEGIQDLLPAGLGERELRRILGQLRADPRLETRVAERINEDGTWVSLIVRTTDMGTRRARTFEADLRRLAAEHLGPDYVAETLGQWWLAQRGMMRIVNDMLASFVMSCLLVLPVLALFLRQRRLFVIGLVPNLLPMLAALGFMAATGISLRIGTAMILAIALGIAIDDTLHLLVGLKRQTGSGRKPESIVRHVMDRAGKPILISSIVLVLGFLSMLSNDLMALRDMGLVAAFTLAVALVADVYLAPALFLLLGPRPEYRVR